MVRIAVFEKRCLLKVEPAEVGVAVVALRSRPQGEDTDLSADPSSRTRGESLADGNELSSIRAVAELADRVGGHFDAANKTCFAAVKLRCSLFRPSGGQRPYR